MASICNVLAQRQQTGVTVPCVHCKEDWGHGYCDVCRGRGTLALSEIARSSLAARSEEWLNTLLNVLTDIAELTCGTIEEKQ